MSAFCQIARRAFVNELIRAESRPASTLNNRCPSHHLTRLGWIVLVLVMVRNLTRNRFPWTMHGGHRSILLFGKQETSFYVVFVVFQIDNYCGLSSNHSCLRACNADGDVLIPKKAFLLDLLGIR